MDHNHPTVKRLHWYILILTFIVLGLVLFIINSQFDLVSRIKDLNVAKDISDQTSFKSVNKGVLKIESTEDLRRYKVGQPIALQVFADSDEADIVGFDVLLQYDKQGFSITSTTTPLEGYTIVPTETDTHLSITAVQNPGSDNKFIFSDEEILELVLNPLSVGTYEFSIVPNIGEETTKFVSTNSQILIPQTATFTIEVY